MTNTENIKTVSARFLADSLDLETVTSIEIAAFMLGAVNLGGAFRREYSVADAARIHVWICGNGGQDIDGGVY